MIIIFDGVCKFCNAWVSFVLDRDPGRRFRFATLQSPAARRLLGDRAPEAAADPDSVVLVAGETVYFRSAAALRIFRHLSWPWPLLYALTLVPRPIRDRVYDWVARNRYRWFGRYEQCPLPSPELRSRYLEDA